MRADHGVLTSGLGVAKASVALISARFVPVVLALGKVRVRGRRAIVHARGQRALLGPFLTLFLPRCAHGVEIQTPTLRATGLDRVILAHVLATILDCTFSL